MNRRRDEPSYEMSCYFPGQETEGAVKIVDPVNNTAYWIPWSQVLETHKDKSGYGTIVMTEWLAKQKGLIP